MAIKLLNIKYISRAAAGIVILVLIIAVIIQNRRISSLLRQVNSLYSQEEAENYKSEINKLKSQIADMQSWQDYLENALNEKDGGSVLSPQNRFAGNRIAENVSGNPNNPAIRNGMRSPVSFRYNALAEAIGLSEEKSTKLMGLLDEMMLEVMNKIPGRGRFSPEMGDRETIQQQIEEINSKYNEKISELLSDDELYAFREYQNSESERMLIMGFNNIFEEDNPLDQETEKELVAAMYRARQNDPDTKSENDSLSILARPFGPPQMNESTDNAEKLNSIYLESAKDILSDDQMQKFEEYLNTGPSLLNMRRGPRPGRFQDAE